MPFDDSEDEPELQEKKSALLIQAAYRSSRIRKTVANLQSIITHAPPGFSPDDNVLVCLEVDAVDRTEAQHEVILEQFVEVEFFASLSPLQQLQCCQSVALSCDPGCCAR